MNEARQFIDALTDKLRFRTADHILDLACGKGRHSIYLYHKGFEVTGVDLSTESIAYARRFAAPRLQFAVHDMREVYRPEAFDYVLNLFTSFGYFDTHEENARAIAAAAANLRKGGKLVLDFMNTPKVLHQLVAHETKTVDNITFDISREHRDGFIFKTIRFEDKGEEHCFQERVMAINYDDFTGYFHNAGLDLLHLFGDYRLNAYDTEYSDRMIFVLTKQ